MAYGYNGFGNYSYPFPQNNDPWRQSMYAQNYNNALNQQFNGGASPFCGGGCGCGCGCGC